jgi:hypothetical protein
MGRPLKTLKYNQGVNVDGSTTSVYVGYGYPTNGEPNNSWDTDQPGIIGGWPRQDEAIEVTSVFLQQVGAGTITANTTSAVVTGVNTNFEEAQLDSLSGATIYSSSGVELGIVDSVTNATSLTLTANCTANITAGSFTFADVDDGFIIRQKGKKKFLVARRDTIRDEGIALGGTYMITDASNTDWFALGAGTNATNGKIFTATASGVGLTTDGEVYAVGTCVLVDGGTLGLNEMAIEIYNDGTTTNAMSLTNRWTRDFDNSNNETGTKYLASSDNDTGDVADTYPYYTIVKVDNWC